MTVIRVRCSFSDSDEARFVAMNSQDGDLGLDVRRRISQVDGSVGSSRERQRTSDRVKDLNMASKLMEQGVSPLPNSGARYILNAVQ